MLIAILTQLQVEAGRFKIPKMKNVTSVVS